MLKRLCHVALLLASLHVLGCATPDDDSGDVVLPMGGALQGQAVRGVDFGWPREVTGNRFLLVPVSVRVDRETAEETGTQFNRTARRYLADEARSRAAMEVVTDHTVMTNLIVHYLHTRRSRPLLDRRALITRIDFAESREIPEIPERYLNHLSSDEIIALAKRLEGEEWPENLLLVGLVEKDTNGDGILSGEDVTVAYAADLQGNGLVQLTPAQTHWNDLIHLSDGRAVLTATVDMNGDGKFRSREPAPQGRIDEHRYYLVDLTAPAEPTPLLPENVCRQVLDIAGIATTRPAK